MTLHIPFVEARWYGKVKAKRRVDVIVVHDMEAPEKGDTAENIANYFANLPSSRKASAHYNVDSNSIVQSVPENDIAYAAPGANMHGLHIEHAGYARQSRLERRDRYSKRMLKLSAALAAELAAKYDIPRKWLTPEELRAGKRGFTSHRNVSKAFGLSSHTDPGPNFPHGLYLGYVRALTNHKEDVVTDDDIKKIADQTADQVMERLTKKLNKQPDKVVSRLAKRLRIGK